MKKLIIGILFIGSVLNAQEWSVNNLYLSGWMQVGTSTNSAPSTLFNANTDGYFVVTQNGQNFVMDGSGDTEYTATYYVATPENGGSDSNPGTFASPFGTWEHLDQVMSPGDTAYIRGGTYRSPIAYNQNYKVRFDTISGTIDDTIKIWAYPGETPILNLDNLSTWSGNNYILSLDSANYVHIKGLHITGASQNPQPEPNDTWNIILSNSDNCVIEQCVIYSSVGYGYTVDDSDSTLFLNCDVYELADPYSWDPYGGSNGFSFTGGANTSDNTIVEGCRAWFVSDDGFDMFGSAQYAEFKNCWAFWNGYLSDFTQVGDGQGFKMGQLPYDSGYAAVKLRKFTNCLGIQNYQNGFDANGGVFSMEFLNNTTYDNGGRGFYMGWNRDTVTQINDSLYNNLSYSDQYGATWLTGYEVTDSNSWELTGVTVNTADFVSLDSSQLIGPRNSDGSLPTITFINLAGGSDLIDRGIDVGLPFEGSAPDVGAFERESVHWIVLIFMIGLLRKNARNKRNKNHIEL